MHQATGKFGYRYGDYIRVISVTKENYQNLSDIIKYLDRELSVLVSGRIKSCWVCKERGHIAWMCPKTKKPAQDAQAPLSTAITTTITAAAVAQSGAGTSVTTAMADSDG